VFANCGRIRLVPSPPVVKIHSQHGTLQSLDPRIQGVVDTLRLVGPHERHNEPDILCRYMPQ
jgi:hypothetical protein